jgi:pimeloyl-CoA dehydrogenase small subunit
MDFDLSDEQRLLKDSVDRLVADKYQFAQRKKYMAEPLGYASELWSAYAELGLLGLPFAESEGGFGGGGVETMIVMESFGRGLVLEPYFPTVVLGGGLLRRAGSPAQRAALAPLVAQGKLRLAFAHIERQSRYELHNVAATARKDGAGWVLDGAKSVVLSGDAADKVFVTARTAGAQRDRGGVGLFLVDANAPGVSRRAYATQDGTRAAEIALAGVRVGADACFGEDALPAIEHVVDEAIAALCAEAVGAMQVMNEMTLEYLKTRKQFGRTIGSFQVLQHRAVDMLTELEQARGMAMYAAVMAADADAVERRRAISAAKIQIGRSGRHIGQEAVQLHGGIGMTAEYAVGSYFKRMTTIGQLYGDADQHLRELARMGGLFGQAA